MTNPATGEKTRFLSRSEAKKELQISEATFHKYMKLLVSNWSDRFQYMPRQTHWNDYQLHCLAFVKNLFDNGLNQLEVADYISRYKIPDPEH
ncbi:hypothetical protein [Oscillatoria sp. CS-180]|uniref:hypothetical protein n=1 Tax=Oscillatoria sp. CS-180 TaxID=3021720 RepID=UPI00232F1F3E|nr:hypothetical protein [Oscillatoria sp. CS-180]